MARVTIALGALIGAWSSSILAAPAPASANASAQPAPPIPVPRSEFIATMDSEFHKMDADKDGILTRKEIEDFQRAVSFLEIDRRRRALFDALDSDHNGQ